MCWRFTHCKCKSEFRFGIQMLSVCIYFYIISSNKRSILAYILSAVLSASSFELSEYTRWEILISSVSNSYLNRFTGSKILKFFYVTMRQSLYTIVLKFYDDEKSVKIYNCHKVVLKRLWFSSWLNKVSIYWVLQCISLHSTFMRSVLISSIILFNVYYCR